MTSTYINPNVKDTVEELYEKMNYEYLPIDAEHIKINDEIAYIRRDFKEPSKWKIVFPRVDDIADDGSLRVWQMIGFRRSFWVLKSIYFKQVQFFKRYTDYQEAHEERVEKIKDELLKYMCSDVVGIITKYRQVWYMIGENRFLGEKQT